MPSKPPSSANALENRHLCLITDSLPVLISFIDTDFRYRFVNKTYESWFGLPREQVLGRTVKEVEGAEAAEVLYPYMEQAMTGIPVVFESDVIYRKMGPRHIKASYIPEMDDEGVVNGICVLVEDTSERRETEDALVKSEVLFRMVVEATNDGIWEGDLLHPGNAVYNKRFREIIGVGEHEDFAPNWYDELIHPDDVAEVKARVKAHLERNEPYRVTFRLKHASGQYRHCLGQGKAIRDEEGRPVRMVGTLTDITEAKEAEEALRRSVERERLTRRVAQLSDQTLDLQSILDTVTREVGEFFSADRTVLVTYEHIADDRYRLAFSSQYTLSDDIGRMQISDASPELTQALRLPKKHNLDVVCSSSVREYTEILKDRFLDESLPDMEAQRMSEELQSILIEQFGVKSNLRVPIIYRDVFYGTLSLHQCTHERQWLDEEVQTLEEVALQVGNSLYQANLYQEEQQAKEALQRGFERERLTRQIVEIIGQTQDTDIALRTVAEVLAQFMEADRTSITRFEMSGQGEEVIVPTQFCRDTSIQPLEQRDIELIARAVQLLTPAKVEEGAEPVIAVSDMDAYKAIYTRKLSDLKVPKSYIEELIQATERSRAKSILRTPIRYRGVTYGSIAMHQCAYKRNWKPEEHELLKTVAENLGSALYQAKLHEQERIAKETIQHGFEREQLIRKIVEVIGQSFDIDLIMKTVAKEVGAFLRADRSQVARYTVEGGKLLVDLSANYCAPGVMPADPEDIKTLFNAMQNLSPQSIVEGDVHVLNMPDQVQYIAYLRERMVQIGNLPGLTIDDLIAMILKYDVKASLRVNILYRGKPYGTISVSQCAHDRQWLSEEVELLKTIADHAGSAIYQAELYQQEQKAAKRESIIRRIVETIHSPSALEDKFQQISDEIGEYLDADHVFIARYDQAQTRLFPPVREFRSEVSIPSLLEGDLSALSADFGGFLKRMCREERPVEFNQDLSGLAPETVDYFRRQRVLSGLGCAISYNGNCLAILFVHQTRYNRIWTDEQKRIIESVAKQAAIATHQAELLSQEQQARQQQEAVAELGLKALFGMELQALMDTAARMVADTFSVEFCKIGELLPDAQGVLLRSGVGWHAGLMGTTVVGTDRQSQAGFTLLSKEPVIVEDLRTETRFNEEYLSNHGVVSGLSLVIYTFGRPWGVMSAHSTRYRQFSRQDINFFQAVTNVIAAAIERKQTEEQLFQAKNEAETANRKKSEFLAMMSHELRTPLNSILGYSRMLENGMAGPTNEKQARYIQNVSASGNHLLNIVNDLLDISKVEAGKMLISPGLIEVLPIVQEVQSMMGELADKKNVRLTFDVQPDVEVIEADPSRFKQILINLVSNGIKFNRSGGSVAVRLFRSNDRQWLIGEVEDTGVGIPREKQGELFRKFYQVDTSASRSQEGTGLGLALSKELLELHGGEISVVSEVGVGSTFTFRIPVNPVRKVGH